MTTCAESNFIRFTERVFRERLSICVCASFPFGFEGGMWDFIVLVPDHCLSFDFSVFRQTIPISYCTVVKCEILRTVTVVDTCQLSLLS